jgi:hypothetical protein
MHTCCEWSLYIHMYVIYICVCIHYYIKITTFPSAKLKDETRNNIETSNSKDGVYLESFPLAYE